MKGLLSIKSYRHLFFGQFFSDFGAFLDIIAINILISYIWGLGPAYNAALLVVFSLPVVFIGPIMAVWVDRLPKKAVMLTCDIVRSVIALSLVWVGNVYVLFVLVFFKVLFGAMFDPARQSTIRYTVPENYLLQASTMSQIMTNFVKIVAPAAGSALLLFMNPSSLFIFESAGFLISAIFIFGIPAFDEKRSKIQSSRNSFFQEFKEGFGYIRSNSILSFSIFFLSAGMFIVFLQEALITPWAKMMGFGKAEFGLIVSASGLGMVVGAVALGKWTFWDKNPMKIMLFSGFFTGFFVCLFGLGVINLILLPKIMWVSIFFLTGIISSGAYVPFGYILQKETLPEVMGRVSGASNSIINLSVFLGPMAGGVLAASFSMSFVFIASGLLLTTYAIIVYFYIQRNPERFKREVSVMEKATI
ncbi:MFS transporter [Falsibacillus pallidus]|uniref:MFS transporter n=1 Tax=Falsibacillus pallidus TaxID=493781 RepID=UPI003D95EBCC